MGGRWVCRAGPTTLVRRPGWPRAPDGGPRTPRPRVGPSRRRPTRRPRRSVRPGRRPAWTPCWSPGRTDGSPRCRCRRPPRSRPAARRRRAGAATGPRRPARRDGRSRTAPCPPVSSAPRPTSSEGRTSRSRRPTPEDRRRSRQPRGLGQPRGLAGSVPQAFLRRPREHLEPAGAGSGSSVSPQSWWTPGHGHDHPAVPPRQVPRRREVLVQRGPAGLPATQRRARSGNEADRRCPTTRFP